MREFKKFNHQIHHQFDGMCKTGMLFRADVSGNELWELYLSSFKDEQIFRDPESSVHNCNCCKNFIRRYGNIVSINDEGSIESIFSNISNAGEYQEPAKNLNDLIKSKQITGVFIESYKDLNESLNYESCKKNQKKYKLGVQANFKKYTQDEVDKFGVVSTEKVYEFNHFCVDLPKQFVNFSINSIDQINAKHADKYYVFKRAMEEIHMDTLSLVKDLIVQGSLLDGSSHLHAIQHIFDCKKVYSSSSLDLDLYCWKTTYNMDERVAKFKNTLIGVLCTELSEGIELNKACLNWNKRVDPTNYHKATAPITKRQIDEARKFVEENGYAESFDRRLATIHDIKASEIMHINNCEDKTASVSIFDNVKATSTRHKRSEFDGIEEVSIDKFMKDVLPSCSSIDAYIRNSHEGNLVAITTTSNGSSKPIFKWGNNYSWTFSGNLAGKSQIKETVKSKGGIVDGVLRFSIMWAEGDGDNSDLDAHCVEPGGNRICFSKPRSFTGGNLDIDITDPRNQMPKGAVENITYPSLSKMPDGIYNLVVHQYSARNSKGFKAEVEFDNEIYSYEYTNDVRGYVPVAEVTLNDDLFSIIHKLPESNSSRELWGLETNKFHRVSLACLSPNHWLDNKVGNLHYFFMLNGCKSDVPVRGFHNENLIPELLKHKKVMEVLGSSSMLEPSDYQLGGIGFNSTVRDELIVKCDGSFKRTIKIKF